MGSSSSKPSGSGSGSGSRTNRTKHTLSSLFICGASSSSSHTNPELEDDAEESLVKSVENLYPLHDGSHSSVAESSPVFSSEVSHTSSKLEAGTSSASSNGMIADSLVEYDMIDVDASNCRRCLSKNKGSVSHQPSQELVRQDASVNMVVTADDQNLLMEGVGVKSSGNEDSSGTEERLNSYSEGNRGENHGDVVIMAPNSSDSGSRAVVSDCIVRHQLPRNESPQVTSPSTPGLVRDSVRDLRSEDVLHVDMVSISSDISTSGSAEISNSEARRNSRRLFWDVFSRRSFRRHNDSPSILFASGGADDLGSRDRWQLDLNGDLHHDEVTHWSSHLAGRTHHRSERRWLLRPEISERVFRGLGEGDRQTTSCASGLHPHGTCSCESFLTMEEFGTLASISRIIMLAEALFEVLEELYQQPFSLSLSMPAPESVVDSFPVKSHKKSDATINETGSVDDVQQCYICLAEYEEGDRLRVLPCCHEYHVSCIDKWLKEINRVCPLCRRNICEDSAQGSAVNAEVSSQ